mmetsp:Transcript_13263/g.31027  ORF Transcript_13263/g.31027 Transcript_13263/m.31027 type:complete len:232 (-) Transcript_13263:1074-1769(-)
MLQFTLIDVLSTELHQHWIGPILSIQEAEWNASLNEARVQGEGHATQLCLAGYHRWWELAMIPTKHELLSTTAYNWHQGRWFCGLSYLIDKYGVELEFLQGRTARANSGAANDFRIVQDVFTDMPCLLAPPPVLLPPLLEPLLPLLVCLILILILVHVGLLKDFLQFGLLTFVNSFLPALLDLLLDLVLKARAREAFGDLGNSANAADVDAILYKPLCDVVHSNITMGCGQ